MISRQLELGFENQPGIRPPARCRNRSARARWWFDQMRGVVNHAPDWPSAPTPARASRPPSDLALSPAAKPTPSPAARNRPAPAAPLRWKFSRTRRLIWE